MTGPLLELFRADVEACGARIEQNLAAGAGGERLPAIARDAQTIASGARLLGLEPAARLAQAIVDAAGGSSLPPAALDALHTARTLLARIAAAATHLDGWMAKHGSAVDETVAAIAAAAPAPIVPARVISPAPAPDTSLLTLFRSEAEAQVAVLNQGLLALEQCRGNAGTLDALLRAAHSVKGAARAMHLDAVVRLSHELEACLLACQAGRLSLAGDAADALLGAVDHVQRLCAQSEATLPAWLEAQAAGIDDLVDVLARLAAGEAVAPAPVAAAPAAPLERGERVVRVAADNLSRIMALAGETVVESRWLDPFSSSLLALKRRQLELGELLDRARNWIADGGSAALMPELLQDARWKLRECQQTLADRMSDLGTFSHQSASLSARLYNEVIASRLRPFGDGTGELPRLVRDLGRQLGKQVRLEIVGEKTRVDRDVLERLAAPLSHLTRNALDHGLETPEERSAAGKPELGALRVEARHRAGMLVIVVADDGRGVDLAALRRRVLARGLSSEDLLARMAEDELLEFLFLPGFSLADEVTDLSGRGVGLDVVREIVQQLGGQVRAESRPGRGMAFLLELPVTRSVMRTLLVEIAGEPYAFPLVRVERILALAAAQVESLEGRQYFDLDGKKVGLVAAPQVLGLPEGESTAELNVVVVSDHSGRYGLTVDAFLGERDLVVQPLDPRLAKVPDVAAASIMQDGTPVVILDVDDLVRSVDGLLNGTRLRQVARRLEPGRRKRVLVIDDSVTVRELERRLLESRGYAVDVAVDGIDGWNAVRTGQYDCVVTDVDMPRLSGLDLIARIRADARLAALPVVIVSYKDRDEDRRVGLGAGANQYLGKGSFHDEQLAGVVLELIGAAEA